ncbi:hypothetical protein [Roseococcus pinisoli]|uniref:DNA-directed DNA polymerase family A palm domain-containing protein n=1 Tax=Roseococcus pinisoli TaxID=2835040 RepID=A0ABS5QCK0_9PROT|nr:hypothetical protein [Roseococcus pinisoli]MBS7811232.1 hypothetical protein [Roseococcus pinisoli]
MSDLSTADAPPPAREAWHVPNLAFTTPAGKSLARAVRTTLDGLQVRQRAMRALAAARWQQTVESLSAGLAKAHLGGYPGGLAVSLAKPRGPAEASRYAVTPLPVPMMRAAVQGLQVAGLASLEIGRVGRRSTLHPTSRFAEMIAAHGALLADVRTAAGHQEVLVLRDAKRERQDRGDLVEYADTAQTQALRREVEALNSWLAETDLIVTADGPPVDTTERRLRRIFNRPIVPNSAEDFAAGGRLYGGFWQPMPGRARLRRLRIGGERVAAVDWSAAWLRIAYAHCGSEPPDGDLYASIGPWRRDALKTAVGALLVAHDEVTRFPQGVRELFGKTARWRDVRGAIFKAHPPIETITGTEFGLHAMCLEATALLCALERMRSKSIVALPVHDAVVVPAIHADAAQRIMEESFRAVIGVRGMAMVKIAEDDAERMTPAL